MRESGKQDQAVLCVPQICIEFSIDIVDINECNGTTPCDQLCMNTVGSYECGCSSGYELQQDGQTCEGQ